MMRSRRFLSVGRLTRPLGRLSEAQFTLLSALVILPPFLALVDVLVATTQLRYLLYPSLAAIGYDLFIRDPTAWATSLRNAVLGPTVAAALGMGVVAVLPPTPLRVLVVVALVIAFMRLLDIELAATLSVAMLTLLAGSETIGYLLSVAASSLALTLVFRAWRRFLYLPLHPDAEERASRRRGGERHQRAARE